jgi:hypothetical protein
MLGMLSEATVEKKEIIRNVFRNIIPISDIHASTNLPKSKPEEMSAADLLVLLHEEEKKIGVSAAKEGKCGTEGYALRSLIDSLQRSWQLLCSGSSIRFLYRFCSCERSVVLYV